MKAFFVVACLAVAALVQADVVVKEFNYSNTYYSAYLSQDEDVDGCYIYRSLDVSIYTDTYEGGNFLSNMASVGYYESQWGDCKEISRSFYGETKNVVVNFIKKDKVAFLDGELTLYSYNGKNSVDIAIDAKSEVRRFYKSDCDSKNVIYRKRVGTKTIETSEYSGKSYSMNLKGAIKIDGTRSFKGGRKNGVYKSAYLSTSSSGTVKIIGLPL
mmetsp:Transcript_16029/g.39654  ORF Transcript_16029/g.39654 Transcript_16029/m.39654 type:complete len:214 (+) Transcript_16029:338-979(+)|eukprot:CAMPEP_0198328124 /NCGR_PEP_ID=MMETSP1450-20131203/15239_1 /TAXON_ID=753684 ORGANISM="Madagascaria erythrocladiodes, Strain CCMP3234" /NCGR_SAMPLE_ID=MMETSP1450 /ASSEMBLY_ACC=CAM_ASM_001115 /LENGTH=213 /DNA_ID=CAMNT_0044032221 /DNA_START=544 /DNA_END=1185 /DNA_ORIENTATION=+